MKLKEMIQTLRTANYERVEIRNEDGWEIATFPANSTAIAPYLDCEVSEWFPHGAPGKAADFTVYIK